MTAACFGDAIHAQVVLLPRRFRSDIKAAGQGPSATLALTRHIAAAGLPALHFTSYVIEPILSASTSSKLKFHGTSSFQ